MVQRCVLQCGLCWNKEKCLKPDLKCVNRWSSSTVQRKRVPESWSSNRETTSSSVQVVRQNWQKLGQQMLAKIIPPDIHSCNILPSNVVKILLPLGRMDTTRHHWLRLYTDDHWDRHDRSKDWPRCVVFALVKPKHIYSAQYHVEHIQVTSFEAIKDTDIDN